MRQLIVFIGLLLITGFISCGQTNGVQSIEETSFREIIYDTCVLGYRKDVPRPYWYSMDEEYNLDRDIDSVLYLRINVLHNDIKGEPYRRGSKLSQINTCNKLGFLYITEMLRKLPKELDFKQFPELRCVDIEIKISDQQLEDLLCTAKKLRSLELVLNGKVPDCICELDELRYLEIINRGNLELPDCFRKMKSLEYLSIFGAGIGYNSNLNEVIWDIPSLKMLHVDGGTFVDIKPTIAKMNRLRQLEIGSVDSIAFPDNFTTLDSLELLRIGWIRSEITLPYDFSKLKRLKGMQIYQTALTSFPDFNSDSEIQYLQLTDVLTKDTAFHFNFHKLKEIEYLFILSSTFFQLEEMPETLRSLKKLKNIELIGFGLTKLPEFIEFQKSVKYYDQSKEPNIMKNDFIDAFYYYKYFFEGQDPFFLDPQVYE